MLWWTIIAAVAATASVAITLHYGRQARSQRQRDLQPAPSFTLDSARMPTADEMWIRTQNGGGAARPWLVVAETADALFMWSGNVGAHATSSALQVRTHKLGSKSFPDPMVNPRSVMSLARDVDGHWWDVSTGKRVDHTELRQQCLTYAIDTSALTDSSTPFPKLAGRRASAWAWMKSLFGQ